MTGHPAAGTSGPAVLLHSPWVWPSTWLPVARRLQLRDLDAVVPDLRHIGRGGPPYWPRVVEVVTDAMGQLDDPDPLILVAHSGAGVFLPVVADASPRSVAGAVIVDAGLPAEHGESPVVPPEFLGRLRGMVDSRGRLPRWTDWWPDDAVAALLPDPAIRAGIVAEQPRLPLSYAEETVPVPAVWASVPCAYLRFSDAYGEQAEQARRFGWPVRSVRGRHLHQVVAPDAVTDALVEVVQALTGAPPDSA